MKKPLVMMYSEVVVIGVVLFSLLCGCVLCKECTNTPTELSSKTVRAALLSSKNDSWKTELIAKYNSLSRPTDDPSKLSSSFLARRMLLNEENWAFLSKEVMNSGEVQLPSTLKEASLHDVRLEPSSTHWEAQQTNLEYLMMLDNDRLLWSFRKTAGLSTPGSPYGGWEEPTMELRGHFVGHYLSATALMWASTHNDTLKEKMDELVSELAACQDKIGTGYLSAFPSEFFDRFESIGIVWAPYYTIHKILAGLLDQYTLAGNKQALEMTTHMVEYFYNRVQNVITLYSVERHYLALNEEVGGMNDVLYRLYIITQDQKHLFLAHLFDKPCFLGVLAVKADDIAGFHANTHIPLVIGSQMRYEVTGDPIHKELAMFFMDIVNSSHAFVTGGTSSGEFWTDPKRLANTLTTETQESCTTYNMLKVSRNLFRWTKEVTYADYYERALTNGVLGIQRGRDPGVMIYMLPLCRGCSKAVSYHKWGTKFDSFWCCYGTGIESFSKLGDSIYFEEEGKDPALYIIQYISSSLDWKAGKILVNQKVEPVVSWDSRLQVTLTISSKEKGAGKSSTINLRIPHWTYANSTKATLNGAGLLSPAPGEFLSVTRQWKSGDKITLELPLSLRTEAIKDDRPKYATVQAILYGPYLLAGLSTGDWDIKTGNAKSLSDWITPIPESYNSYLISLSQGSGNTAFTLININQTIAMTGPPSPGSMFSVHATFRLVLNDSSASSKVSSPKDAISKLVMLEPFAYPGMVVLPQADTGNLVVGPPSNNSTFHLIAGLNGKDGTVSLESHSQKGCFVYNSGSGSARTIKLRCQSGATSDAKFNEEATFVLENGIASYHPISFVAKGVKGDFLLSPLHSMRDEYYTAHFNITA